jgi:hypothetical protein
MRRPGVRIPLPPLPQPAQAATYRPTSREMCSHGPSARLARIRQHLGRVGHRRGRWLHISVAFRLTSGYTAEELRPVIRLLDAQRDDIPNQQPFNIYEIEIIHHHWRARRRGRDVRPKRGLRRLQEGFGFA